MDNVLPLGSPRPLLTVDEARALLGISRRQLYRLCAERGLPFVRVGRGRAFRPESLRWWLAEQEGVTGSPSVGTATGRGTESVTSGLPSESVTPGLSSESVTTRAGRTENLEESSRTRRSTAGVLGAESGGDERASASPPPLILENEDLPHQVPSSPGSPGPRASGPEGME